MLELQHIVSPQGPKRVGPFSHAVKAGEFIFITGQMPTLQENPDVLVSNDVEKQTHQVMKNLLHVLKGCGSTVDKVIFARVYLVNFDDFDIMNNVYASYFDKNKLPARTCIGVTGLALGASVEIDFIAGI